MKINEINSKKDFSFSCIYMWINTINNKKYVGQTINFYNRMIQYKKGKYNQYMKNAIMKYGIDAFEIKIIEKDIDSKFLNEREQYWIDYYKSYKREFGYNICQYASSTLGYKHTEESKQLMSDIATKRFKENPMQKPYGERNGMYNKKHTDKWKKEHSDFLKEKWKNQDYRDYWHSKMSNKNNPMYDIHLYGNKNGMYGKHHSEETKKKISQSKKGQKSSNGKKNYVY